MNILVISAMFPPIRTGTSFYTKNLASALHKRGHRITVLTLENLDADRDEYPFRVERMPALHAPVKNYFKHFRICSFFPSNYGRLLKLVRESAADVLLLVNHYLDIAFPAVFAARRLGIPLICSVGTQLQSPNSARNRVLNFFDRLICGGIIFPSCARVVAWDDQIVRYLVDVQGAWISARTTIVNYGVNGDPAMFSTHVHDYGAHNQILGVGSVIEQRDYTALVRAFGLIAEEFPRLVLKIVGHVYFDRAVRLATELGLESRVHFTGEQPHSVVLDELQRSDAYFASLTGRYTGLGTATIEAMLLGTPTLVNTYPEVLGPARLESMRDAILLRDLAPEQIARELRILLRDESLRRLIGEGGRRFVAEHMSWERVAEDFERVLSSVVPVTAAPGGSI